MIASNSKLTQAQAADTKDKAKTSRDGAQRAVRNAWSHILYPVKTSTTEAQQAVQRLGFLRDRAKPTTPTTLPPIPPNGL
jgi:hypothetical protein